ncbi:MAG TPA: histidine phosphatase family protein [Bdellovibrionota bacterium]|jgi:probable phosphoglycerate mutase|nr:histidine phosphatase family protein [Bdellovibrionota bacterium]
MRKHAEIFVFRHGETDWNREGRFQGHTDVPLNEVGRAQARSLIRALEGRGLEAVLASDLSRATETGQIVADALGIPLHTHSGLREAHLGDAQGLTFEQIEARFGSETLGRWRSSLPTDADVAYPGGESGAEVMNRAFAALEDFLRRHPFQRVGVATHGGVVRRILQKLLPPHTPPVPIPNGILYRISRREDGRWEFEPFTPV